MTASIRNMNIDEIFRGKRGMFYIEPAAVCGIRSIMKTDGRCRDAAINIAFRSMLPLSLSYSSHLRWVKTNREMSRTLHGISSSPKYFCPSTLLLSVQHISTHLSSNNQQHYPEIFSGFAGINVYTSRGRQ